MRWGAALCCVILGCGGAQPAEPVAEPEPLTEPETVTETETETVAETETEEEAEANAGAEAETGEEAEAEEEEEPRQPGPPVEPPLSSPDAEEMQAAILAASSDRHAFRRLVDPDWGVGVFDPAEAGVRQYCEMRNIANNPGLGFIFNHGDDFSCNRDVSRCTVKGDDRSGYAFLFREGEGDAVWLNAIVSYPRRVPNRENRQARTFLGGGDGVCAMHNALRSPDSAPPSRFSVFVSEQTGLVPEVLAEHECGDGAAAAFQERLGVVRSRRPRECNRNPSRCVWRSGDEDYTVYATDDGAPFAVTITRHSMHDDLARAQDRDAQAFLREAERHTCE